MRRAEPSFGYAVLARILASERHKVVVTTNFDNLVADALSIYGETSPLVCGHESLAAYARSHPRRPLVAKIHRDLLLSPMNDPRGTDELSDTWRRALSRVFSSYTPIFIGYGGNDGSLMGFLERLPRGHVPGRLIWCCRPPDAPPERVVSLLRRLGGVLVSIDDFDALMMRLNDALGYTLLEGHLDRAATRRRRHYMAEVRRLSRRIHPSAGDEVEPTQEPRVSRGQVCLREHAVDVATPGSNDPDGQRAPMPEEPPVRG
jgi:hypothetical protein